MPERWEPWRTLARRHGTKARVTTRLASSVVTLSMTLDGIVVEAFGKSTPHISAGKATDVTRVSAPAAGGEGLRLSIRRGKVGRVARLLGAQDAELGHKFFDRDFIVKTNDEELARAWVDTERQRAMLDIPEYEFSVVDGSAVAERQALESDPDRLERVAAVVAALAGRGVVLLEQWRELARSVDGLIASEPAAWSPGSAEIKVRYRSGVVYVETRANRDAGPDADRHRLVTRVRCERATYSSDCYVMYCDALERDDRPVIDREVELASVDDVSVLDGAWTVEAEEDDDMRRRLTQKTAHLLSQAGTEAVVATRNQVSADMRGLVTDARRVQAAIALAHDLAFEVGALESQGPYR